MLEARGDKRVAISTIRLPEPACRRSSFHLAERFVDETSARSSSKDAFEQLPRPRRNTHLILSDVTPPEVDKRLFS